MSMTLLMMLLGNAALVSKAVKLECFLRVKKKSDETKIQECCIFNNIALCFDTFMLFISHGLLYRE